jgi:nucleotide-binding universal stress UspA family protein
VANAADEAREKVAAVMQRAGTDAYAGEAAEVETRHERRILACYDGSPESVRALERAAEVASAVPSSVTVVSVAEPIYRRRPYTGYADPAEKDAHRRLLEDATRRLSSHGIAAATLEPSGETAAAIVEAARDTRADLIVIGSRHRSLIQRLLAGSVSGQVVVEGPADVLVVR